MSNLGAMHHGLWFAVLVLGWRIYRVSGPRPVLERLIRASIPITAYVVVWHWVADIAIEPITTVWSGARLASSVALQRGLTVYADENHGPVTDWIYPPGSLVAYLPVAWIRSLPAVLLAGRSLSLFYFYAPVAWLLLTRRDGENRIKPSARWLLLVTFGLLSCSTRALRYSSTEIHSDAPALGLAALALIVMTRSRSPRGQWAAIGLATLSVWAKQLTIPILAIALPVWAYRKGGLRGLRQVVPAVAIISIFTLILFVSWFDASHLFFNIITIPMRHPRRFESFLQFDDAIVRFQQANLFLIVLFLVGILGLFLVRPDRAASGDTTSETASAGADDRWLLFLVVTLAEAPFALMAFVKMGGDDNNLSFFLYFMAITAILLMERLLVADGEIADDGRPRFAMVLVGMNVALSIVMNQQLGLTIGASSKAAGVPGRTSWKESGEAANYIRSHPGRVYFPWNPLEHLLVENRLYHFEYGVYDRDLAGHPISEEHFLRHIPAETERVYYPNGAAVGNSISLRYLKGFVPTLPDPALPGWSCYARAGGEVLAPEPERAMPEK